jgi:RND family efflux transporter MFP subunit
MFISRMVPLLKNKWTLGALVVLLVGVFIISTVRNKEKDTRVYTATTRTVAESVQLSGDVRAVDQLKLIFKSGGKVSAVNVTQGQSVEAGSVIAELDTTSLRADLAQAQSGVERARANLALVRAQNRGSNSTLEAARTRLQNTKTEQETLVQNAWRELLTNDIQAYQIDTARNVVPLTITGSYQSDQTGSIEMDFYSSAADAGFSAKITGITKNTISFDVFGGPVALGTTGLYVTIPTGGSGQQYGYSEWTIPIPNTRSSTYQVKLGAFERAKKTQLQAVTEAESNLRKLEVEQVNGGGDAITLAQERQALASIREAEAQIAKVEAQIADTKIIAPFSGIIAQLDYAVGETIAVGDGGGATLVSSGDYELTMSVPEVDVAKIAVGNPAHITLDVYGDAVSWNGAVTQIELVETQIDGVPVYATKIKVLNPDPRIRIGMNARATIVVNEVSNVVAIPMSYIKNTEGTAMVAVERGDGVYEERAVTIGLRGTDNFVEIQAGLIAGDVIVSPSSR